MLGLWPPEEMLNPVWGAFVTKSVITLTKFSQKVSNLALAEALVHVYERNSAPTAEGKLLMNSKPIKTKRIVVCLQELAKYKLYLWKFPMILKVAGSSVKDSDQYGMQAAITLVELDQCSTQDSG
jgi:hypothetical protein